MASSRCSHIFGTLLAALVLGFIVGCGDAEPQVPETGSQEHIQLLIDRLAPSQPSGNRVLAAGVLASMGQAAEPATAALEEMAKDRDPDVRNAAKSALEKIKKAN